MLFILAIHTGLRMSDIVQLRIEDVRNRSFFSIREGKTKKWRMVYVYVIKEEIARYLSDKPLNGWLFPFFKGERQITVTQAYRVLTDAGQAIGRNDCGTHTCRKTFGYHYYQRTKDIDTLMEIFNHSNPQKTKRYIGIRHDDIKNAFKQFRLI